MLAPAAPRLARPRIDPDLLSLSRKELRALVKEEGLRCRTDAGGFQRRTLEHFREAITNARRCIADPDPASVAYEPQEYHLTRCARGPMDAGMAHRGFEVHFAAERPGDQPRIWPLMLLLPEEAAPDWRTPVPLQCQVNRPGAAGRKALVAFWVSAVGLLKLARRELENLQAFTQELSVLLGEPAELAGYGCLLAPRSEVLIKTQYALREQILMVGSPGSGKSTLLNRLIGGVHFTSHMSFKLQAEKHEGGVCMNKPGLADARTREVSAEAITEALQRGGAYKVFFVCTVTQGRVKPEDVATIKLVLDAAPDMIRYGVIINQVPPEDLKIVSIRAVMSLTQALNASQRNRMRVFVNQFDEELVDEESKAKPLQDPLKRFIDELPAVALKQAHVDAITGVLFEATQDKIEREPVELQGKRAKQFDKSRRKCTQQAQPKVWEAEELQQALLKFRENLEDGKGEAKQRQAEALVKLEYLEKDLEAEPQRKQEELEANFRKQANGRAAHSAPSASEARLPAIGLTEVLARVACQRKLLQQEGVKKEALRYGRDVALTKLLTSVARQCKLLQLRRLQHRAKEFSGPEGEPVLLSLLQEARQQQGEGQGDAFADAADWIAKRIAEAGPDGLVALTSYNVRPVPIVRVWPDRRAKDEVLALRKNRKEQDGSQQQQPPSLLAFYREKHRVEVTDEHQCIVEGADGVCKRALHSHGDRHAPQLGAHLCSECSAGLAASSRGATRGDEAPAPNGGGSAAGGPCLVGSGIAELLEPRQVGKDQKEPGKVRLLPEFLYVHPFESAFGPENRFTGFLSELCFLLVVLGQMERRRKLAGLRTVLYKLLSIDAPVEAIVAGPKYPFQHAAYGSPPRRALVLEGGLREALLKEDGAPLAFISHQWSRRTAKRPPSLGNVCVEWVLEVALTTPAACEPYELTRLAWLGDATIFLLTATLVFCMNPRKGVDWLIEKVASIVSNKKLGGIARQEPLSLNNFLATAPFSTRPKVSATAEGQKSKPVKKELPPAPTEAREREAEANKRKDVEVAKTLDNARKALTDCQKEEALTQLKEAQGVNSKSSASASIPEGAGEAATAGSSLSHKVDADAFEAVVGAVVLIEGLMGAFELLLALDWKSLCGDAAAPLEDFATAPPATTRWLGHAVLKLHATAWLLSQQPDFADKALIGNAHASTQDKLTGIRRLWLTEGASKLPAELLKELVGPAPPHAGEQEASLGPLEIEQTPELEASPARTGRSSSRGSACAPRSSHAESFELATGAAYLAAGGSLGSLWTVLDKVWAHLYEQYFQ